MQNFHGVETKTTHAIAACCVLCHFWSKKKCTIIIYISEWRHMVSFIHSFIHPCIHPSVHSFIQSFMCISCFQFVRFANEHIRFITTQHSSIHSLTLVSISPLYLYIIYFKMYLLITCLKVCFFSFLHWTEISTIFNNLIKVYNVQFYHHKHTRAYVIQWALYWYQQIHTLPAMANCQRDMYYLYIKYTLYATNLTIAQ